MTRQKPGAAWAGSAFQRAVRSFRFRLTLLFVAILAVILAAFSAFIYTRQVQILRAETVSRLSALSVQVSAYLSARLHRYEEEGENGSLALPGQSAEDLLLPVDTLLALVGPDGSLAWQHGDLPPGDLASLQQAWGSTQYSQEPLEYTLSRQAYLFSFDPLRLEGNWAGTLILGSPVDPGGQLGRLALSLGLSSVLVLLGAFGGGFWLADRAMRPVQSITQTARRIGESDLNRRLNLRQADELGELADTFDQMLDRLQAAFERQRQFTADASHELRSPLAIIELEANRALERPRTVQEYEKALRLIQSENEWMSRLVDELLLLARMDSGRAAMRQEKLDLSAVAVDVTERLHALAEAKGVALTTGELAETLVQADGVYLAQVFTNLVENAIKYSQGEHARVVVETASLEQGGIRWSLAKITDNGPGIPPEHLPHIFDRFYRIDPARLRQGEEDESQVSGSGLGLAIARAIVQAYGGRIDVQSSLGQGTTFTVWLPAA